MNNLAKAHALLARFDALCAAYAKEHPEIRFTGPGKGPSITSLAMRKMAKEEGAPVRGFHLRLYKARCALRVEDKSFSLPEPQPGSPVPTLTDWGIPLDEGWTRDVARIQRQVRRASAFVRAAKEHMKKLQYSGLPVRSSQIQGISNELGRLIMLINGAVPACLCPYCKGIDSVQKQCVMCDAQGYLTAAQKVNIPAELVDLVNRRVRLGREYVAISDLIQPAVAFATKEDE